MAIYHVYVCVCVSSHPCRMQSKFVEAKANNGVFTSLEKSILEDRIKHGKAHLILSPPHFQLPTIHSTLRWSRLFAGVQDDILLVGGFNRCET